MAKAKKGKLTKADRRTLGNQIITFGHLSIGALVFKQVYSEEPFNLILVILGLLLVSLGYTMALMLMRGGDDDGD